MKIGAEQIQDSCQKVREAAIRLFGGSLPLDMLDARVDHWISFSE
jgi:hypothetical protein